MGLIIGFITAIFFVAATTAAAVYPEDLNGPWDLNFRKREGLERVKGEYEGNGNGNGKPEGDKVDEFANVNTTMTLAPPFTEETAREKVKVAQNLWNTRDPQKVIKAYTETSIWRNRDQFLKGHAEIVAFLTRKWEKERDYRLRKELFLWGDDRIAVQFWYEYRDVEDGMKWKRCYGIEHWTFEPDGRMRKRQMSGNDLVLEEKDRWFVDGVDVDDVDIGEEHF